MSDSLQDTFVAIISDFFSTFSIDNPVIPDYRIVDDIADAYLELRPDVLRQSSLSASDLNNYNGFAVAPKKMDGTFTVLINKKNMLENIENKNAAWVGTIVHETTHVQDFTQYAQMTCARSYDTILRIELHGMFNLWTEVNARAKGYYFTRKYTFGEEKLRDRSQVDNIKNIELSYQKKLLHENYHATNDGFQQAYLVAQYIGRLYTIQQLFPQDFSDEWIAGHFGDNKWMTDWFLFYKQFPTLSSAFDHFDDMKAILRQNFIGLE